MTFVCNNICQLHIGQEYQDKISRKTNILGIDIKWCKICNIFINIANALKSTLFKNKPNRCACCGNMLRSKPRDKPSKIYHSMKIKNLPKPEERKWLWGTKKDYDLRNWCSRCNIYYDKDIFRCDKCKQSVRSRPKSFTTKRKEEREKRITRY